MVNLQSLKVNGPRTRTSRQEGGKGRMVLVCNVFLAGLFILHPAWKACKNVPHALKGYIPRMRREAGRLEEVEAN